MRQELTGWEKFTGYIAKTIVFWAFRVNRLAALSICLEITTLYHESIEVGEEDD